MTEFASTVRRRRKSLNLTMTDLARAFGCSVVYWSEMERGAKSPPTPDERLAKVAEMLRIEADKLADIAITDRMVMSVDRVLASAGASKRVRGNVEAAVRDSVQFERITNTGDVCDN